MWARLLVVAVVLTAVGGAAWWFWAGPDPGLADACVTAERAAVRGAPAVFEPTIHWQAADLPEIATDADEQVMLAVTQQGRHGWVAAGRVSIGPEWHALMLASTDGATWQSEPGQAVRFAGAEIGSLVELDRRVIAAGSLSGMTSGTGVWVGRGPLAWQVARGRFEGFTPTALAAGEGSALLLGIADAPAAWSSVDGVTWDQLALDLPVAPALASFAAVRPDDDGWLAVGSIAPDVDGPAAPIVWASTDGAAWRCRVLDSAGFEVARPMGLYRSAQGWLAVGIAGDACGFAASCVGKPIAWTSPDGVRWSEGRIGGEPWHTGGIAVAGSAEGFVAVGHGTTWWSADGSSWVEVADGGSGVDALQGQPDALFMTDDGRLLVAGTAYEGADADAWIATGFLAR
jgi:hypothetical protein